MNNDLLWVEKYRPTSVKDCLLPASVEPVARSFVEKGSFPNFMLSGSPGTGKTALAMSLATDLDMEVLFLNGSNEGRLIDTLRNQITQFATSISLEGHRKVVIIDEADGLTPVVQDSLRSFIEKYASNCGFILTCNFPNRFTDAIASRITEIPFTIQDEEKPKIAARMLKRACGILDHEGVGYDKKVVAQLVSEFFPDFRRVLNELQRYSGNGQIDSGILAITTDGQYQVLIDHLKAKDFKEMRKWVATCTQLDLTAIARALYDSMYGCVRKTSIPDLVLLLADYMYKDNFVADREINVVAMLTQIMMEIEFE